MPIHVSIVEDSESISRNLAQLIDESEGYKCLSVCDSGEEALRKIPLNLPQVILMDIHLPGMNGVECTRKLKAQYPEIEIVMLTVYKNSDLVFQALEAGASGYLLKRTPSNEILEAIAEVVEGGAPMSSHIARKVVQSFKQPRPSQAHTESLTEREREILDYVAQGYANKDVADALCIGTETIRFHLKNIYRKLHVRSRTEAAFKYLNP